MKTSISSVICLLSISLFLAACETNEETSPENTFPKAEITYKGALSYHLTNIKWVDSSSVHYSFDTTVEASYLIDYLADDMIFLKKKQKSKFWPGDMEFKLDEQNYGINDKPGGSAFERYEIRLKGDSLIYDATVKCGMPCTEKYTVRAIRQN